ncbi:hypothetical protein MXB_845 [Myxobolus squamalis]|nr:hypothetical protein MXB_845 [Myxobolus squamalis]
MVLKVTIKIDNIFHTAGVHPTRCAELEENTSLDYIEKIVNTINNNRSKIVAIGEIGLETLSSRTISESIVHCFTGNSDEARKLILRGLCIGITGWLIGINYKTVLYVVRILSKQ